MELYKKYRPNALEAVIGNEDTVAAMQNMVQRKRLPHVILFHGPSGCGKTTLARILRRALGCSSMDFVESNSSSFRGIDTIRDVARVVNLSPVAGPCRVWLFDEVHKWTNDAQNAALKILEDTPSHVYFFLCTTDPQKLVKPILTRCCEMPVRGLTGDELTKLVKRTAKREEAKVSEAIIDSIVASADGSARTALVLLDKVLNLKEPEREAAIARHVEDQNEAIDLCRALIKKSPWKVVAKILRDLKGEPESTRWAVLGYARSVLLNKADHQAYLIIDVFKDNFYDSKAAGLVAACFEVIHAD
jgi:DNA polymerase III gamma/tau subunit